MLWYWVVFFFQAEDGIRDLVRSRGLGDVYKRQRERRAVPGRRSGPEAVVEPVAGRRRRPGQSLLLLSLIHI